MELTIIKAIGEFGILCVLAFFYIQRSVQDKKKIDDYENKDGKRIENLTKSQIENTDAIKENTRLNREKIEIHKVLETKVDSVILKTDLINENMLTKTDLETFKCDIKNDLKEIKELIEGAK